MLLETTVITIFIVVMYYVYRFVTRDDRIDSAKQAFLDEVKAMNSVPVPETEIRDYDEKREDIYKLTVAIRKKWCIRNDLPVDPKRPPIFPEERMRTLTKEQHAILEKEFNVAEFLSGTWMAELGPNDMRVLKSGLVARAMANLPRYEATRSEVLGKFELFKRQLINESQWNDTTALNQEMVEEINFIKAEAELMEKGWGQNIFALAAQLRKQSEEQMQRNQAQQIMAARMAQQARQAAETKEDASAAAVRQRKK